MTLLSWFIYELPVLDSCLMSSVLNFSQEHVLLYIKNTFKICVCLYIMHTYTYIYAHTYNKKHDAYFIVLNTYSSPLYFLIFITTVRVNQSYF